MKGLSKTVIGLFVLLVLFGTVPFVSAGLGGVLNYNSTLIRNKYDGMQGLNVSVAVFA